MHDRLAFFSKTNLFFFFWTGMITFLLRVWRSFWGFLPAQLVERTRHDKEGEKTKGRTTATASKDLAHGPPSLGIWHVRRRLPHVHVWPCQLLASSCSSKQAQALPPGWTVAYLIDTPKPIERASLAYAGQPGERDSPRLASSPNCCCPASLARMRNG